MAGEPLGGDLIVQDFRTHPAIAFCFEYQMKDYQLALHFDDSKHDVESADDKKRAHIKSSCFFLKNSATHSVDNSPIEWLEGVVKYLAMFRVIVQNPSTHLFLGEKNEWKKQRAKAKVFGSGSDAIKHCLDHKIKDYQLVIRFNESKHDLQVPCAAQLADCDGLVNTIKAAARSRHPIKGIPTPPLPRHQVLCTELRAKVESLKQLPSLLLLLWNSPKLFRGNQAERSLRQ